MAISPSHQFGQIIGDALEAAIEPLLAEFAKKHGLFLDKKGKRPARPGNKLTWQDSFGNTHDLDYVLEQEGSASRIGAPIAFIETAWRRYTKHSRNKAQEIQGAILPLAVTHKNSVPFIGVVLAGVFTQGSIDQLKSQGFSVVYISYESVVAALDKVGIDASFTEKTPDKEFARKVAAWKKLTTARRSSVLTALVSTVNDQITSFLSTLESAVTRRITMIRILPLHGTPTDCTSVQQAMDFLRSHDSGVTSQPFVRFEIGIRYSNGDRIEGTFADKNAALSFLSNYAPPAPKAKK